MNIYYLDRASILQIHDDALNDSGGSAGIRVEGAIDSAIIAPQTNYFGEEHYRLWLRKPLSCATNWLHSTHLLMETKGLDMVQWPTFYL